MPPFRTTRASRATFDATLASAKRTMLFSEIVRLAVDSFRASKIRFALTALGMVIGINPSVGLTGCLMVKVLLPQASCPSPVIAPISYYAILQNSTLILGRRLAWSLQRCFTHALMLPSKSKSTLMCRCIVQVPPVK